MALQGGEEAARSRAMAPLPDEAGCARLQREQAWLREDAEPLQGTARAGLPRSGQRQCWKRKTVGLLTGAGCNLGTVRMPNE